MNQKIKLLLFLLVGLGAVFSISRVGALSEPDIVAGQSGVPRMDVVDVSSNNGRLSVADYQTMKKYGVQAVIVKITEYTTYKNPYAAEQIANARAAGLNVGVYHYSWYTTPGEAQAEARYFANYAKALNLPAGTLLVDDLEDSYTRKNNVTNNATAFNQQVKSMGYTNTSLYTGLYYASENNLNFSFIGNKRVWMAQYPYYPSSSNLLNQQYGMWQWNSRTRFPGVSGNFDVSIDYAGLIANAQPEILSTSIEGNPATGNFNIRVKTNAVPTITVKVPIWSTANGQDDLVWYPATKVKDGEYLATFDATNHNYESGAYYVHAYAYNGDQNVGKSVDNNLIVAYPTTPAVHYQTHVQSIGWQQSVTDGATGGTTGRSLRVEGIKLAVTGNVSGGIQYQTHVQSIGWQNAVANNTLSGTTGQALRMEAVRMNLTGNLASQYDIYYRAHIQSKGWLGWAKNGTSAGSQGLALRLEAIQVKLVKKGAAFDTGGPAFIQPALAVNYQTHVQTIGWQAGVKDGAVSGTSGKSLRLEGIKINISNVSANNLTGGVQYQTHVQKIGWQEFKENNDLSGTTGQALRLEGIRINLTGTLAQNYDIYYRVHIQDKGWLGWAKNGASAGSQGLALRLEAIQIKLVKKGTAFDAGGTAFVATKDVATTRSMPDIEPESPSSTSSSESETPSPSTSSEQSTQSSTTTEMLTIDEARQILRDLKIDDSKFSNDELSQYLLAAQNAGQDFKTYMSAQGFPSE